MHTFNHEETSENKLTGFLQKEKKNWLEIFKALNVIRDK